MDVSYLSPDEYRTLRRQLIDVASNLLMAGDPEETRGALDILRFLRSHCPVCMAKLEANRDAVCVQCAREQP
jgi:hypothetical protein